jgi:hypothetical protein
MGIFADGLIHEVLANALAADGPFDAYGFHGTGTNLRITVSFDPAGSIGPFINNGLFKLAMGARVIENAGDGR